MALSVSVVDRQDIGFGERVIADVTFDSSYPWGGEEITARALGFRVGSKLNNVKATRKDKFSLEFVPNASLPHKGKLLVREATSPRQDLMLNSPGLQIGTSSAAAVRIGNITTQVVGGAVVEHAAVEQAFTATTHDITANASLIQEAYYLVSTVDGVDHVITKGTTAGEGLAVPPAIPANAIPLGLVLIQVAAGATDFDATSDDLDAAHLTTTFEDLDGQVYQATDLSALTMRVEAVGR